MLIAFPLCLILIIIFIMLNEQISKKEIPNSEKIKLY